MAVNKPEIPSSTLPETWGGTQLAYSESQIQNGYEEAVPQVVDGGNINYEKKGLFENIKYLRTIVDVIRNTPIGKILWTDNSNKLDYMTPAVIGTDEQWRQGTDITVAPNVKQVKGEITDFEGKFQVVDVLPPNPQADVWYFVKE